MLHNHCKGTDLSPNSQKKTQKYHKPDNFSWFGLPSSSLPIYFCQCCHFFNPAHSPLHYILRINKENIPQTDIRPFLSAIYVVFSQKSNLNRKIYVFRLISLVWMFPNFRKLFPNFSPNLSPNYFAFLRTFIANAFTINA